MTANDFGDEREEIIADFIVETDELIERLDQELVQLEDSPQDSALLNSIFRAAHTIKGTSSFLGFNRMTELTHKAENVLDKLRNHEFDISSEIMDVLLDALDGIRALLDEIREGRADDGDFDPTNIATRLHSIVEHQGAVSEECGEPDAPADPSDDLHVAEHEEEPVQRVKAQTKRIVRSLLEQAQKAAADPEAEEPEESTDEPSAGASDLDALLASAPKVKPKISIPGEEAGPKEADSGSSIDDLLASAPKVKPKLSIPGEASSPKTQQSKADTLDAMLASAPKVKPKISIPGEASRTPASHEEDKALVERDKPLPANIDIDKLLASAPPVTPKLMIPGEGGGKPLRANASLDDILSQAPKVKPKIELPGDDTRERTPEQVDPKKSSDTKVRTGPGTQMRHRGRPPTATDRVPRKPRDRSSLAVTRASATNPAKPAASALSGRSADRAKSKPTEAPIKSVAVEHTIRVDVERLDALMNLAGELVLGRNRLSNISKQFEGSSAESEVVQELANIVANISLITGNIQMAVMKTRMLPIGKVFNRFPRMVRDLAREKKKLVDLQIIGGDTEVDKSVIEAIGDPLVHLIRNSVDHGIEAPALRAERGKNETGSVRLSAEHEGNNVLIKIQDDGNGMNAEKIGQVALSRGVVDESALARMTEKEIRFLIFQPGFSTAETITNTSGRGVGMDVVKTNVEALGGTIDIESEVGRGTLMTIKLPLTLASIQALMVRAADEIYAISLANVVETLRIPYSKLKSVEGAEVIQLRDRVIPVVRLRKLLDCPQTEKPEGDMTYIVVVGLGDQRVGLAVEHLLGQEEVVIKPLGEYLKSVRGIAGSTILGDGGVALILDVASVLEIIHEMRGALRKYTQVK